MKNTIKTILALTVFAVTSVTGQTGIGTTTPDASSILDLTSTNKGLLLPRVANTAAISSPVNGLLIYDISSNCFKGYQNGAWSECLNTSTNTSLVSAVSSGFAGSFCTSALSGTTYGVTITNNDFSAKQITPQTTDLVLSGLTGVVVSSVSPSELTTINAGSSQQFTYTLTGTPNAAGTLTGTFTKQSLSCSSTVTVGISKAVTSASSTPTLCVNTALTPITHTTSGEATGIGETTGLPAGVTAAWASNTITISGTPTASGTFTYTIPISGCGGTVNAAGTITVAPNLVVGSASSSPYTIINFAMSNVTHTTTNATGIGTATGLPTGVTAAWASNTITISGTPTTLGTFNYAVPLVGGCGNISASGTITVVNCGAYVSSSVYKVFACHNLGATDTTLDPNVPVQGIHGNYYQWGKSTAVATASTASTAISGWSTTAASNGSWADGTKTATDPCPTGYRVPTNAQWTAVIANNTVSRTGTWANNATNYGVAIHFGPNASTKTLTLTVSGLRNSSSGLLTGRSLSGNYWSSTEYSANAYQLYFASNSVSATFASRVNGFSVRCVLE